MGPGVLGLLTPRSKETGKKSGGVPHLFFRTGGNLRSENLWTACGTCEKQISVNAKSCPHCGARLKKKYRFLKWGGIGFVAFVAMIAVVQLEAAKRKAERAAAKSAEQVQVAATEKTGNLNLPDSQAKFLAVVDEYATRFSAAKNELQESFLRTERNDAMTKVIGRDLAIDGWIGKITELGTDSSDKAYIRISIAPNVELVTFNTSIFDPLGTMISPGSELYSSLTNMSVGDAIKVSGIFVPHEQGGLYEASLTINGAMTEPAFLFYFKSANSRGN